MGSKLPKWVDLYGTLTKKHKKSIMLYEGFVVVTRVWKRFQTVVRRRIGSTLTSFYNLRPLGRRRMKMNTLFKKMNSRFATVLAVFVVAFTLAACGGGGGGGDAPVVVTPPPVVAVVPMQPAKAVVATGLCTPPSDTYTSVTNGLCLVTETGPVRQAAKAAPRAAQALVPPITANELFDWAQVAFPTVFPAPSTTITASGFVYRYYASTNSYVAVADDGGVYVLFASGDNIVKYVAPIADFSCLVKPTATGCAPVLTMTSTSPLPVAGQIVVTSNQPLKSIDSVSIISSTNGSLAGNASISSDKLVITITPTSAPPYSSTLTITVKAKNEADVEGTVVATVTTEANAHPCPAPSVWTTGLNACVYPMGYKVVGTNELPAGCTYWADQCWKDSVANGTVKFIATSATMVDYNNRPVVFAYYRLYSTIFKTTLWNYLPMYSDDGSLVGSDIYGGDYGETDFAYGSTRGVITHNKPSGECYLRAWDKNEKNWKVNGGDGNSLPVTCPN